MQQPKLTDPDDNLECRPETARRQLAGRCDFAVAEVTGTARNVHYLLVFGVVHWTVSLLCGQRNLGRLSGLG
jgi:hypothetical protein